MANQCFDNYHFGIAVRDPTTQPELIRNLCEKNMLSGILLFSQAGALLLDNICRQNHQWGVVMTPDAKPNPVQPELQAMNRVFDNPRGTMTTTEQPLIDIGR